MDTLGPARDFRLLTFGGLLLTAEGESVAQLGAKRLTFLAVLAAAGEAGIPKERLSALLWPESDGERARTALNQLVYVFRQTLRADAIEVGPTYLRLDARVVTSDVGEFGRAVSTGDAIRALELQHAPFLDGVNAGGNAALERWIDETRTALQQTLVQVAEAAAAAALAGARPSDAVPFARRLVSLDRAEPRATLMLMRALAADNKVPQAVRIAEQHAAWLRTDYNLPPDADVAGYARVLLESPPPQLARRDDTTAGIDIAEDERSIGTDPDVSRIPRPRPGKAAILLAVCLPLSVGALLWNRSKDEANRRSATGDEMAAPVMAVLPFRVTARDTTLGYLGEGIVDLISAKLGDGIRGADVGLVLGEVARTNRSGDPVARVAEATQADYVVTGSVVETPDGLAIDALVRDVQRGVDAPTVRLSGSRDSLLALIDRLAVQLQSIAARESVARLPSFSETPIEAVREYLVGHRAFRKGEYVEALAHLQLALAVDSGFSLAALDLVRVSGWLGESELGIRARRLAWQGRASLGAQDRVLYDAVVGPRFPRFEDGMTKVGRWERVTQVFPSQPDAWFELADGLFHGGAFLDDASVDTRVTALLQTALQRDSTYEPALAHAVQHAARLRDTAMLRVLAPRVRRARREGDNEFLAWRLAAAFDDSAAVALVRRRFRDADPRSLISVALTSLNDGILPDDAERALQARRLTAGRIAQKEEVIAGLHATALNRGKFADASRWLDPVPQVPAHFTRIFDAMLAGADTAMARRSAEKIAVWASEISAPTASTLPLADALRSTRAACTLGMWDLHRLGSRAPAPPTAQLRRMGALLGERPAGSEAAVCALLLDAWWRVATHAPASEAARQALDSAVRSIPSMGTLFESALALSVARVHELAGQPRHALAAVRRQGYFFKWPHYHADELQTEGRLALAVGDTTSAIRAYRTFLALRDAPDSTARPSVVRARTILSAISAR